MTRDEKIAHGERVASEMPQMNAAFDEFKRALFDAWCGSDASDADGRERLFLTFLAADKARGLMMDAVNNGKIEARNALTDNMTRAVNG
jgi:hypothetical protein